MSEIQGVGKGEREQRITRKEKSAWSKGQRRDEQTQGKGDRERGFFCKQEGDGPREVKLDTTSGRAEQQCSRGCVLWWVDGSEKQFSFGARVKETETVAKKRPKKVGGPLSEVNRRIWCG